MCFIEVIVRAIYAYDAQGDDELPLKEGELIELTPGLSGGQHYGDGWWEGAYSLLCFEVAGAYRSTGFTPGGRKGIFPSNYVRHFFLVIW
jgi:formin-binding protein 1